MRLGFVDNNLPSCAHPDCKHRRATHAAVSDLPLVILFPSIQKPCTHVSNNVPKLQITSCSALANTSILIPAGRIHVVFVNVARPRLFGPIPTSGYRASPLSSSMSSSARLDSLTAMCSVSLGSRFKARRASSVIFVLCSFGSS